MPLADYVAVFKRRGWVVLVVALVAVVAAFGFARLQTPLYRSSVRLEVSGRFDYGVQLAVDKQLSPLAQRLMTSDVAAEVDRRLKLDLGPDALLAKVRAAPIAENVQIQVDADDVDPQRAQAIVGEFARVFEEQHAAQEQGKSLSERTTVTTLDRPTAATLIWPQTRTLLLAAAILGLLAGTILAFGLEYLDDTVKNAEDLERAAGLPTLGQVPRVSATEGGASRRGITAALVAARRAR
jgi:capsular polysaccharide biosynthesis protein